VALTEDDGYFPGTHIEYDELVTEAVAGWLAEADALIDPAVAHSVTLVHSDSAAPALLEYCEPDASLLIVGAQRSGLGALIHGSVSTELLHAAQVPLAVASAGTQEALRWTPVSRVTCLVGTRAGAEQFLDAAIETARGLGAPLRIVSLIAMDHQAGEVSAEARERAQAVLDKAADRARATLPDVTTEMGSGLNIEDAAQRAQWEPAEIAMLGSSRLAAPRRLFLGSVATKVARVLPVPLLVIPAAPAD
jgi:nucleotide-binding universal stress UspA family protein